MARLIKLLPDLPAVADAFAAGVVSEAQAAEIAFAAEAVPAGMRDEAAQVLLSQASALKPEELRIAGRRILRHVDPDAAEEHERKQSNAKNAPLGMHAVSPSLLMAPAGSGYPDPPPPKAPPFCRQP